MFKKPNNPEEDSLLVKENQYRAVITYLPNKNGYKASVQRRVGVDQWVKVRCGLKGVVFHRKKDAENKAKFKMREQKSLDSREKDSDLSYIIYDD